MRWKSLSPKEAELAEKSARLAELDALLNMEGPPRAGAGKNRRSNRGEHAGPRCLAGLKAAAAEKFCTE